MKIAHVVTAVAALSILGGGVAYAAPTFAGAGVDDPPDLVEDYAYPGRDAIKDKYGITLTSGDGRITFNEECTGDPAQIKLEATNVDYCFDVKGDRGWLSLRIEGVYLLASGDQNVAASVEGMADPIVVPAGQIKPVRAVDPARKGVVVELRATPPTP